MMFDFTDKPFFDNHTHLLNPDNRIINLKEYIGPFNHGYVDSLPDDVPFTEMTAGNNRPNDISDYMLEYTVKNMGVTKAFANYMSQFLDVPCDFDAILNERNNRSMADMKAYIKSFYDDMNIIGEVLDAPQPMGAPETECFPTNVYRLYQTDNMLYKLMDTCSSYKDLLDQFDANLRAAIKEGFIGVKCHVFERNRQQPHYVSAQEAEKLFIAAKFGDRHAREEVYFATFSHMMLLTQELDFPVHLHAGLTGKDCTDHVLNFDPLNMAHFLADKRFLNSHLVFLHAGYPNVRGASAMAQSFPNVWIDLAQVLPWEVVNMPSIIEDLMGFASHGKITFGSGAHGHPEINWLAAKVAKKSLALVLERIVDRGFMNKKQAEETADCMLYKNSLRLYHIN